MRSGGEKAKAIKTEIAIHVFWPKHYPLYLNLTDRLPSVSKSPSKVNSVRDGATLNGPKSTISKDVIPAAGKQNDGEKPRASSQTFLSKQGSRIALYTDPLWKKISGNDGQPSSEETQPKCSKAVFASYTPAISNGEFLFRSYFQICFNAKQWTKAPDIGLIISVI